MKKILAVLAAFAAASAFADIPLPEHPRPDWERADWVNLNGEWDFGFATNSLDRKIVVPFGWGTKLSGVEDKGDTGYYRRLVKIPESWKGRRVFAVVGAADHDTTCRFGGKELGQHVGGYTPFEFELTDLIRWGEEQPLEFKVWDPSARLAGGKHYLYGKQGYGNVRGIWQTVYLEARGGDYLEAVRFTPVLGDDSASGKVRLDVTLAAPLKAARTLEVKLTDRPERRAVPTGVARVETFSLPAGEAKFTLELKLDRPRLWTLDDPYLYEVSLALRAGAAASAQDDVVSTYFGFREIGVGKNPNGDAYVTLNRKPVYLQLCLDQSYHPDGYYTFPSDEAMKNEILIAKRLALTGNRVHVKVEVPRKLYWADRLGLLIQADVPCAWGDVTPEMFVEHWACFEAMVKRDFNHPSVYQWTLFNETWGLFHDRSLDMGLAAGKGGRKRKYRDETQRRVAETYRRAKALDATRLIEDNSPCNFDHVATDVNTWHYYRPGYLWESTVLDACTNTYPGSTWNFIGGNRQDGAPMMNSECGNVWGYRGSAGDSDFSWDYHLMLNAFRRHLKCGGWLYTEHHDVKNEWNGYVRYDRSAKYCGFDELADMSLADLHRDAAIFFAGTPGRETGEMLAPGQKATIPVGVSLITDRYAGQELNLVCSDWHFDASGKRQRREWKACWTARAKSWQCEKLWDIAFVAPKEPTCGCVVFALYADRESKPVARNFWSYGVTNAAPQTVVAAASEWSLGATNVLGGLKLNGFGKGHFEFELAAPASGGVFRAELSAKRKNGKDCTEKERKGGLDYMLGGGSLNRSKSPNSYPMTSDEKFPAHVRVFVGGTLAKELTLADDPADSRGILSWLAQPHDSLLREAGSYGWLVEAPVPADAVRDGKVRVRIESDNGLAVYGPAFGRYPLGPRVDRP